jgi:hypothetical protein
MRPMFGPASLAGIFINAITHNKNGDSRGSGLNANEIVRLGGASDGENVADQVLAV